MLLHLWLRRYALAVCAESIALVIGLPWAIAACTRNVIMTYWSLSSLAAAAAYLGSQAILLHIIARGKIARSPEAELVARYEKRLSWPVKLTELPDNGSGKAPEPQNPCKTVLLDERGKAMGSEDFADLLGRWRDDGMREARFVLGAADGHSHQEREQADLLLAFGPATWPHLLARAMLMEQLYRAGSILAGHPYHRS